MTRDRLMAEINELGTRAMLCGHSDVGSRLFLIAAAIKLDSMDRLCEITQDFANNILRTLHDVERGLADAREGRLSENPPDLDEDNP